MKDNARRKVRIAAHCSFDGWLFSKPQRYKYYLGYSNKNKVLLNQFMEDMSEVYNKKVKIRHNSSHVPMVEYGSKQVFFEIKHLQDNLSRLEDRELQRIYLKAFFDDEGRLIFDPDKHQRRICGTSIRCNVRKTVASYLKEFGIVSKENGYDVVIYGRENFLRFKNEIGFSNGVTVVRKRSFSKWFGKDKNELLSEMLSSYVRYPVS